jgi:2',3'-cyclic-nucleotide 2'-phosphodiesterase (5'-nucleotidase family)
VVITDLLIDRTEKDGKVTVTWFPGFRIIDTLKTEADPAITASVKGYTDKLDKELGVEIGVTETPLDSRRATVRSQEAAIGNLIADAIRAATGSDVAITNGGGIRADKQYPAGTKLTRKDILAELPFGNRTVKMEIKGDQLRLALENGVAKVETGAGQFPQVSGLTMKVDLSKPAGSRVLEVNIGSAPLDPAKTDLLATNDFMAVGGDGYTSFKTGKVLVDMAAATIMASQVIDYVAEKKTISPKVEGRIVAVK